MSKILIVDNSLSVRETLLAMLESENYQLELALTLLMVAASRL